MIFGHWYAKSGEMRFLSFMFTHYYNYVILLLAIRAICASTHIITTKPSILNFPLGLQVRLPKQESSIFNLQSSNHPLSDGVESEVLGTEVFRSNPQALCSIVGSTERGDIRHLAPEKHIESGDEHTTI